MKIKEQSKIESLLYQVCDELNRLAIDACQAERPHKVHQLITIQQQLEKLPRRIDFIVTNL